jgi:hypothetical protein
MGTGKHFGVPLVTEQALYRIDERPAARTSPWVILFLAALVTMYAGIGFVFLREAANQWGRWVALVPNGHTAWAQINARHIRDAGEIIDYSIDYQFRAHDHLYSGRDYVSAGVYDGLDGKWWVEVRYVDADPFTAHVSTPGLYLIPLGPTLVALLWNGLLVCALARAVWEWRKSRVQEEAEATAPEPAGGLVSGQPALDGK